MLTIDGTARVRAALAPMQGEGRVSAPQTSQVFAGHVVRLLATNGDWWHARSADDYEGWIHAGYLENASGEEHTWRVSLGALVRDSSGRLRALPVGARLAPDVDLIEGEAVDAEHMRSQFSSRAEQFPATAVALFDGARYEWGGSTNWGCDCSGLVQSVFALHGCQLPRDAYQQAECGTALSRTDLNDSSALSEIRPGELLFFSDRDDRKITHVGIAMDGGHMVHSALGRGGVAIEDLRSDESYVQRLRRNFVGGRKGF